MLAFTAWVVTDISLVADGLWTQEVTDFVDAVRAVLMDGQRGVLVSLWQHCMDKGNHTALVTQILKAFEPGELPHMFSHHNEGAVSFIRPSGGANKPLLKDSRGGSRYVGVDFCTFGAAAYFWPPPIVDLTDAEDYVEGASRQWIGHWPYPLTAEVLTAVEGGVGGTVDTSLAFRLCECFASRMAPSPADETF